MRLWSWLRKNYQKRLFPRKRDRQKGFTLTELLVAAVIAGIVILSAGQAMNAIMFRERDMISEQQRRTELNRAIDFIADDIRMSRRVNATCDLDTCTTTAQQAVTNSTSTLGAFNPPLGSIGTSILYLEIPLGFHDCDANGTLDNPQGAATGPTEYIDRVVYDVRPNTTTWMGPRTINRYGRIPNLSNPQVPVDPCSAPQASIVVADGITTSGANLGTCNGTVSGAGGGFLACVDTLTRVGVTRVTLAMGGQVKKALTTSQIYEFNSGVYNRAQDGLTGTDIANYLNTSPGGVSSCTVPSILNQPRPTAETLITTAGLQIGLATQAASGGTLTNANRVATQSINASTTVPCGTALNYTFFPQITGTCTVPNILGQSAPTTATNTLNSSLFLGNAQAVGTTGNSCNVQTQSPSAGTQLACGSTVSFTFRPPQNQNQSCT
uniref:Prepilin-type N-terminal cleavage/methylation domain-containing protein n=1 Tax=Cyanothece sp. (strain PCC 7425 / ATCC 29141) TaxID=395961 RepID=B8HPZ9_CYAP4